VRLTRPTVERRGDVVRLSTRVTWEDRQRDDDVIAHEWPAALADDVTASPDAALLAAYPLALWFAERRLAVEGDVCPRLADGVRTAMALGHEWYPQLRPVAIEATERTPPVPNASRGERRAAVCLSGGVDALTLLYLNTRTVPVGHPARFTDGLFLFGLNTYDYAGGVARPERLAAYEAQRARLAALCEATGVTLLTAATNVRPLFPTYEAWCHATHSAPLASVGHAMTPRLRSLAVASAGAGLAPAVVPNALVDAFHASHALDVHSAHATLPRLEKVRLLAGWPEGLAALRCCFMIRVHDGPVQNCGQCEKCVRTMLEFLAVGALDRAPFPTRDVTPEAVERVAYADSLATRIFFAEVTPSLAAQGRDDLVRVIRRALAHQQMRLRRREPWWRRWISRGDAEHAETTN